jgi:hypothetical protein
MYCKLFSSEFEKLIELYKTKRNEDLILARLEGGANNMILSRYGIYRFPILAIFFPNSKRIYSIYQGERRAEMLDSWFENIAPRIKINNTYLNNNNNNSNSSNNVIDKKNEFADFDVANNITDKTNLTDEDEFIKMEFMEIKKRLDLLERNLSELDMKDNVNIKKVEIVEDNKNNERGNKIVFEVDISPFNILLIIIFSLIGFALYKTLSKIIKNNRAHSE